MRLDLLTRLFGEDTQEFLYSAKLYEDFQCWKDTLNFLGRNFSVT